VQCFILHGRNNLINKRGPLQKFENLKLWDMGYGGSEEKSSLLPLMRVSNVRLSGVVQVKKGGSGRRERSLKPNL